MFKLGDLTRYISESVIIGFMLAAALLLAIGQIGNALGVKDKGNAHMQVLHRLYLTLFHGDAINFRALLLSVTAVVVAVVLRRLVKRFGWPQIDLLAVLVVAGAHRVRGGMVDPRRRRQVGGVGRREGAPEPAHAAHPRSVDVGSLAQLSQGALAIAFIGLIEALSIAKAIAHQSQQKIDYNRQILAEGLANLTGGFFQACRGRVRCRGRRSTFRPAR